MRRKRRGINQAMLLLVSLIVIAVALALTLILLIVKQSSGNKNNGHAIAVESGTESDNITGNNTDNNLGNNSLNSTNDNGQTGSLSEFAGGDTASLPVVGKDKDRTAYKIKFANNKKLSATDISKISGESYNFEFDLDMDGIAEKYQIGFGYDAVNNKTSVNLLEGGTKKTGAEIENYIETADSIDVVTISNNDGAGVAVICKTFDEKGNKYVLQTIVWEYVNDILTKQWDLVYTGRMNLSNGFMMDGYIRGSVRGGNVNYATESHMNGYILNRSTLMADMKNLGIKLPKDTTGECDIEYGRYVSGVARIVVE